MVDQALEVDIELALQSLLGEGHRHILEHHREVRCREVLLIDHSHLLLLRTLRCKLQEPPDQNGKDDGPCLHAKEESEDLIG